MTARTIMLALLAAAVLAGAGPPASPVIEAQSERLVWNGVVHVDGRIIVAGPRWAGSRGPSVALIEGGGFRPFPDASWNDEAPAGDQRRVFVNVNAIHFDDSGMLWVVDTGVPTFGKGPPPGAAKLVQVDPTSGRVLRVLPFPAAVLRPNSYTDDVRFHGGHAFVTDAGSPGVIVIELASGRMRRVLADSPATSARPGRRIVVAGRLLKGPDGRPLAVQTDPMEVSPDGRWLYFGTLEGPWSRISTHILEDLSAPLKAIDDAVEPWADLPPVGGTVMDANGDLYFSDLATDTIRRRSPDGRVIDVVRDARLHWVDAMFIDREHRLWMPVPQLDRAATFHGGTSRIRKPVQLFSLQLPRSDRTKRPPS